MTLTFNSKVTVSPLGLEFHEELSFDEWAELASQIGTALRSMAFVIGDWLVYGESRFEKQAVIPGMEDEPATRRSRISLSRYEEVRKATGVDLRILKNYAYVSRRVPRSLRNDHLSWEHHRAVARLESEQQQHWLETAARPQDKLSSRRLRVSITRGKVVGVDEMATPPSEQGVTNHIPSINRLCGWWQLIGAKDWLKTRTQAQVEALLRDFEPVEAIIHAIRAGAERS